MLLLLLACTEPIWYPGVPAGIDTGPTALIDDTGGIEIPCSPSDTRPPADVVIESAHDAPIEITWLDWSCAEHGYHTLLPGEQVTQASYVDHVWVARDGAGVYLDHHVADPEVPSWVVSP